MEKLLVFHLDDNNLKKLKQITGAYAASFLVGGWKAGVLLTDEAFANICFL